jgi:hypothetical protein
MTQTAAGKRWKSIAAYYIALPCAAREKGRDCMLRRVCVTVRLPVYELTSINRQRRSNPVNREENLSCPRSTVEAASTALVHAGRGAGISNCHIGQSKIFLAFSVKAICGDRNFNSFARTRIAP